jgi:coenzyme F420 biosynthesis associated uncharacterized protein
MRVDWALAARAAKAAGGGVAPSRPAPTDLRATAARAGDAVVEATGLVPDGPLPDVEWVSRERWVDANLTTMRSTLGPLLERGGGTPGGLRSLEATAGAVAGLEIGGLLGMFSRRVLGQYELDLFDVERAPRLLLVAPNLERAAVAMGVDRDELVTWVTLHEVTHAVQFGAVPWLRESLGGAMGELMRSVGGGLNVRGVLGIGVDDLRAIGAAVREGGLLGVVAGRERRALLARVQGTMGLVEGHAEWAMDHAAEGVLPDVDRLRAAMDARRGDRAPMLKILDRLLGMDLKLRQYTEGREFCDAVVAARGRDGLRDAWAHAELAPSPAELAAPARWLARTAAPSLLADPGRRGTTERPLR